MSKTEVPFKKSILIGIPTAKYIEVETFKSIFDLDIPDNCTLDFQYFYGYNRQIRNLMADWAIRNNYDYMFWVDSDSSPFWGPKNALMKLLSHKKDIIAGTYIQRKQGVTIPEMYIYNSRGGVDNAPLSLVLEEKLILLRIWMRINNY